MCFLFWKLYKFLTARSIGIIDNIHTKKNQQFAVPMRGDIISFYTINKLICAFAFTLKHTHTHPLIMFLIDVTK